MNTCKKEAQLSLKKPTSEAQRPNSSHGESDFSEVTQFHARYVNGTLSRQLK